MLLSQAPASADSFRRTLFAVPTPQSSDAVRLRCRPPAPFWGWRSLSRKANQPLTLPVISSAHPSRLHAPTGSYRDVTPLRDPFAGRYQELPLREVVGASTPRIDRRD